MVIDTGVFMFCALKGGVYLKTAKILLFSAGGICAAAGLFVYFGMRGFSFTAYILWALTAVFVCYGLLLLLSGRFPKLTTILFAVLSVSMLFGLVLCTVTGVQIYRSAVAAWTPGLDYVIVLGAGLHGNVPSMTLSDRLNATARYMKENPETVCVVSGGMGPGETMTEAQCMYEQLIARGIDGSRIRLEDRATSTHENLVFSMALITEEAGAAPAQVGILSSEYHIHRACIAAKGLGINPVGIPAKTSNGFLFMNYFLREIPAYWYYTLIGDMPRS